MNDPVLGPCPAPSLPPTCPHSLAGLFSWQVHRRGPAPRRAGSGDRRTQRVSVVRLCGFGGILNGVILYFLRLEAAAARITRLLAPKTRERLRLARALTYRRSV